MPFPFQISIPGPAGPADIKIEAGASYIFVGANGGGKTRLAVKFEDDFGHGSRRIAAHRALNLNPEVSKISEEQALKGLRFGSPNVDGNRQGIRWQSKSATTLLNDFDFLVQALFADQNNVSLRSHVRAKSGQRDGFEDTKFERMLKIWNRLLPHRSLEITGDNIKVLSPGGASYNASDMSDGERAIFYVIGQVLTADDASLLIFDEPELHIHRSILGKLWDELEAERADCAFLLITHDLEFAASRVGTKYVIRSYKPSDGWLLETVPDNTGFSEEIATLILGSRRPILFVEGGSSSLDNAIYRACYRDFTVIPRGSCGQVIHSVVTMRANMSLTRVTCSGIVDADDYSEDEKSAMAKYGVSVLPVSEIENVLIRPEVSRIIASHEGYKDGELDDRLNSLKKSVFGSLNTPEMIENVVARYCRRRIDRELKRVDLSAASTVSEIEAEYKSKTGALDITSIASAARDRIAKAVGADDLTLLLSSYDNKGMMGFVASHLKGTSTKNFEAWIVRALQTDTVPGLRDTIRGILPSITAG